MLVDIVSDLHVEFNGYKYQDLLQDSKAEVIIVAGDLGSMIRTATKIEFHWLTSKYKKVYYVPGNHDYYGTTFVRGNEILNEREKELSNLIVLRPGVIETLGGSKLIGATLWVEDNANLRKRENLINDPFQIPDLMTVIGAENKKASNFISENADSNTIVVTHHLPSLACVAPQYINEGTNAWFVSDESYTLEEKRPFMWIFGHSHVRSDNKIYETRMINNAYGYPTEYKPFKQITYDL
jgi:predicted phosphodiesterase